MHDAVKVVLFDVLLKECEEGAFLPDAVGVLHFLEEEEVAEAQELPPDIAGCDTEEWKLRLLSFLDNEPLDLRRGECLLCFEHDLQDIDDDIPGIPRLEKAETEAEPPHKVALRK